ncbi:hypothetical protein H4O18_15525 [Arenibacter sp. BSSL-BM3]|uniref:Transposase n=1 Tax=Arenibacter arenosicollis TaxID=2762274 RepID=A0ABR7QQD2_9FLAO|nr:hypothetical protein [Arenibacter arenosicollis]MBC8769407.1 hypothetical protein [Arenibacter arenosicollis]
MVRRFKSLSLSELKWGNGFRCPQISARQLLQGSKPYSRQCTSCRYDRSPTANTLFHRVIFDLLKAFCNVYFVAINKKGGTSLELASKLSLMQKTCWALEHKVIIATNKLGDYPIKGRAEVDETVFGTTTARVTTDQWVGYGPPKIPSRKKGAISWNSIKWL